MPHLPPHALFSVAEMAAADRETIAAGTPGSTLMQWAGTAVAAAIEARFAPRPVAVLAGGGNNGGDGFVIAQALLERGWKVSLGLLGEREALKGDAALAAQAYRGAVQPLHPSLLADRPLVVDALFGTGLSRPVGGVAAEVLGKAAQERLDVVAVDIPSGVDGDTGAVLGIAAPAVLTVTFHRKKRGHVLCPGREYCGEVVVADIGITAQADARIHENTPELWWNAFPWPSQSGHKFQRGHAVVQGGDAAHSGAARLAARAALRAGAGVVTVACDAESLPLYAAALEAVMTRPVEDEQALVELLRDERVTAYLIGPAAGIHDDTRQRVSTALALRKPVVLDADALTVFSREPEALFAAIGQTPAILTPHEGEFARLFGTVAGPQADKLTRALAAARASGAVVVLKGADTVVAAPDGRAAVNTCATPFLATAGSGDVLAGIAAGLLAARMPAYEAACAAVWLHGMAGRLFGAGLIAEDLPDMIPHALQTLSDEAPPYDPAEYRDET